MVIEVPERKVKQALQQVYRTGEPQDVWNGRYRGLRQWIRVVDQTHNGIAMFESSHYVAGEYEYDSLKKVYRFWLWKPHRIEVRTR